MIQVRQLKRHFFKTSFYLHCFYRCRMRGEDKDSEVRKLCKFIRVALTSDPVLYFHFKGRQPWIRLPTEPN